MKIVYLSNFINHHQKPLADCLYQATGGEYRFIETEEMPMWRKQLGYQEVTTPYLLRYNKDTKDEIEKLIMDAEAVICGEAPSSMIKKRVQAGLLTFRDDERRYKSVLKYLKWPVYTYHSRLFNKGYLLCASAYGARDYVLSGMKPSKCYKWGYFPEVISYGTPDELINLKGSKNNGAISILWVGRLIELKHPELAIIVAENLKSEGYKFELNIVGTGVLEDELKTGVLAKHLDDVIKFRGSMPPDQVREYMDKADIFMFTSSRREGWGAVLNESMSSGCAVVASHAVGSVPYLIKDGENGLIFKSQDALSFYTKVKFLMDNHDEIYRLGRNAYLTMRDEWSPQTACRNLLELIEALKNGKDTPILAGPCSKAPIMNHNWM